YRETWQRGVFARSIKQRAGRIKLLGNHQQARMPLGVVTTLRDESAGLFVETRVSDTSEGNDALALIRDGALDGFSVGFTPIRDQWTRAGRAVTRVEASLRELSLTAFPAISGAVVAGVRAETRFLSGETAARRLAILERTLQ